MLRLFLECAVRSALMAAGTGAVLAVLRVNTARARHVAWAGVMISMLLLPAWTAWGPKAALRVLPAAKAPAVNLPVPAASVSPGHLPAAEQRLKSAAARGFSASYGWARLAVLGWTRLAALGWGAALFGRSLATAQRLFLTVYFLGVALLLARLAIGTVRAQRLIRSATHGEGRLTSAACAAPVTVGWLRPIVILPECWRKWPRNQLAAVLTHEGEHARRRDPLVQWLALLNRAVFWFHPLAWYLERRLSGLAEEACDAAVLAEGHDPYEYSDCLLKMAQSVVGSGARVQVLGMAMPGSFLAKRIRQIMDARPVPHLTRARMVCAAAFCAILSAVFAAGAVDRQRQLPAVTKVEAPAREAPAFVAAPAPPLPDTRTRPVPRPAAWVAQAQTAPPPQGRAGSPEAPPLYADHRLLAMYFDQAEMNEADLAKAVAAAQKFVRTQIEARDLVAIMTYRSGGTILVRQDFTDDHDRLVETLQQLNGSQSASVSGDISSADRRSAVLRTAIQMLGRLESKKLLLFFASGPSPSDTPEERQATIEAATRANVAVYLIDVRGVAVPPR